MSIIDSKKRLIMYTRRIIAMMILFGDRIKQLIKYCRRVLANKIMAFLLIIYKHLPLTRTIVFECENDMDDNPRAVFEYCCSTGLYNRRKLVWMVKNVELCKRLYSFKNTVFISRYNQSLFNRIRLEYYLCTSKWFIFSHPYWFRKRKNEQIIINVNHGTPFKNKSLSDKTDIALYYDYLVVPTDYVKNVHKQFWLCSDDKVLICGFPRNDFLFLGQTKMVFSPIFPWNGEKVVICMPTYKKTNVRIDSPKDDIYSLDVISSLKELENLNEYLYENNIHLIIKPHPLQKKEYVSIPTLSHIHYIDNTILLKNKIMLYELIGKCDGLITDVSSVFFDYLLVDKPIGFLMNNVNSYRRGIIWDKYEHLMPGKKIYSISDLVDFFNDIIIGKDQFAGKREDLNLKVNGLNKNNNCECFVNIIRSL